MLLPLAGLAALIVPSAVAHVPGFDEGRGSPENAFVVEEPTKSWVFFDSLGAGGQHWFTFALTAQDELFVSLSQPPAESGRPSSWLLVPGSDGGGPAGTPAGWGGNELPAKDELGVEPFTPVALRTVAEWRGPAPVTGTYYVVVEGEGAYSLAIGSRESFTPGEWLTIPVDRIAIQRWAGVPWPLALIGEAIGLVGAAFYVRKRRLGLEKTVGIVGAAMIAGTSLTTGVLAAVAVSQAGASWAVVVSVVFALGALGIGYAAFRLVAGSARWWSRVVCAVLALVLWAGLLVGPAVLVASAVVQARRPATGTPEGGPADPR